MAILNLQGQFVSAFDEQLGELERPFTDDLTI
jgi:hypothetical protein